MALTMVRKAWYAKTTPSRCNEIYDSCLFSCPEKNYNYPLSPMITFFFGFMAKAEQTKWAIENIEKWNIVDQKKFLRLYISLAA
jgi:hypothetical protein